MGPLYPGCRNLHFIWNSLRPVRAGLGVVALILVILSGRARAESAADAANRANCSQLPQIDPAKSFVGNFSGPCWALRMESGNGTSQSGDPNAIYDEIYYTVNPGYELIILGQFPNARFLSATAYDEHLAATGVLVDNQILPLNSSFTNPYLPGANYKPGQWYGLRVSFGGGPPLTVAPGCNVAPNIETNSFDVTQIHSGMTWQGYPGLPAGFPQHQTGPNASGMVTIRKYASISAPINETVIVRSLADGCAIPAQQAVQLGLISASQGVTSTWLNQSQINTHHQFSTQIESAQCFPPDPRNQVQWQRQTDYIAVNDTAAGYQNAAISASQMQSLLAGQSFLRVQLKAPTTPAIPCTTGFCTLTGNEQVRYLSISLQSPALTFMGPVTVYSIADQSFVKDPNGNVTLLFSFGAIPPPQVTAANYYTYIDMTQVSGFQNVIGIREREILPNATFKCSIGNIPLMTTEFNPSGGYMGPYVPTVDFPTAAQLPTIPVPISRPNSCGLVPTQQPAACAVQTNLKVTLP